MKRASGRGSDGCEEIFTRPGSDRTRRYTRLPVAVSTDVIPEQTIRVLDHGFVRLDDAMASDLSVVNAARVSFARRKEDMEESDEGLVRFLMRERHGTPFEHNAFRFHIRCPIFVAREWMRHRVGSFNEFSMRYAKATDDFYVPEPEDVRTQVGKPGAYSFEPVEPELAEQTRDELRAVYDAAFAAYERLVELGVAREIARCVMPVGAYTEFYWTINARSLMNFVSLRAAETAQREIRRYAEAVEQLFAAHMPVTHAAFVGERPHRARSSTGRRASRRFGSLVATIQPSKRPRSYGTRGGPPSVRRRRRRRRRSRRPACRSASGRARTTACRQRVEPGDAETKRPVADLVAVADEDRRRARPAPPRPRAGRSATRCPGTRPTRARRRGSRRRRRRRRRGREQERRVPAPVSRRLRIGGLGRRLGRGHLRHRRRSRGPRQVGSCGSGNPAPIGLFMLPAPSHREEPNR